MILEAVGAVDQHYVLSLWWTSLACGVMVSSLTLLRMYRDSHDVVQLLYGVGLLFLAIAFFYNGIVRGGIGTEEWQLASIWWQRASYGTGALFLCLGVQAEWAIAHGQQPFIKRIAGGDNDKP